jgi:hypothetical protein
MDNSRNRRTDTPGGNPTAAQFSVDLSRSGRASLSAEGGHKWCATVAGAKQDNTFMTPYGHLHRHNGSSFTREVCRIALCLDEILRWNLQPTLKRGILQDFRPICPNPSSIGHGKESFRRPYFMWYCRSSSVRESADVGDVEINRLFHFRRMEKTTG